MITLLTTGPAKRLSGGQMVREKGGRAMPRGPRLDASERLHHAAVRGIERRIVFREEAVRGYFHAWLGQFGDTVTWALRRTVLGTCWRTEIPC